jgi:hypothetical protein
MKTPNAADTLDSRIFVLNGERLNTAKLEELRTSEAAVLYFSRETPWKLADVLDYCGPNVVAALDSSLPAVESKSILVALEHAGITPYMSLPTAKHYAQKMLR